MLFPIIITLCTELSNILENNDLALSFFRCFESEYLQTLALVTSQARLRGRKERITIVFVLQSRGLLNIPPEKNTYKSSKSIEFAVLLCCIQWSLHAVCGDALQDLQKAATTSFLAFPQQTKMLPRDKDG